MPVGTITVWCAHAVAAQAGVEVITPLMRPPAAALAARGKIGDRELDGQRGKATMPREEPVTSAALFVGFMRAHLPVEPNPPSPRAVSGRSATSSNSMGR